MEFTPSLSPLPTAAERPATPLLPATPVARPNEPAHPSPAANVRMQVGRLVLDGFDLPVGGEGLVQAAFESELGRLLEAEELPVLLRSGGARRELPGKVLSINAWSDPDDLGRQIARAIFAGMQR